MTSSCMYAKWRLINSGIDFNSIPKEKILMTCAEYTGTISEENYKVMVEAIEEIYKDVNTVSRHKTPPITNMQLTI